ncbi:universal stress protein [Methylobacterium nigriterrae]|uniref:universal stress protein n=1 Tax=Methylobacterium nigriterrae TaxID=3127512 RepID=UPI00301413BE
MKTFFVPVVGHEGLETLLATACLAAQHFDGLIEGACILPALADYVDLVGDLPWTRGEQTPWADRLHTEALAFHEAFAAALMRRGIREAGAPGSGPSYRWHSGPLTGDDAMSQHSRLFSASIVRRPKYAKPSFAMESFQALLFESGRPVLISPPISPTSLGETIMIAWNGSTETTRAVVFAMPFLRKARQVVVLEVEGSSVPGPTSRELAMALKCEGVLAEGRTVTASKFPSGEIFLAEAQALGCDLLIKGAYTQSRLRQIFFGGATSHILHHAELPVLMAH